MRLKTPLFFLPLGQQVVPQPRVGDAKVEGVEEEFLALEPGGGEGVHNHVSGLACLEALDVLEEEVAEGRKFGNKVHDVE